MNLTAAEIQDRIEHAKHFSPMQAQTIRNMVLARFEETDEANLAHWRERYAKVRTQTDITNLMNDLRAIPTRQERQQAQREAAAAQAAQRPTEVGYYRNPANGELYRLTRPRGSWELNVHKYSETGGPRRLLTDGSAIVKGKWRKLNSWDARRTMSQVKKEWLIDPATLASEYAYGFCPFHHGPLTDAVSVILGYGKDCAAKQGLPWSEEYAQQVLAERSAR